MAIQKLKVGLQLSIGGLGDKSFNDSAYSGLKEAEEKYGIEYVTASWPDSDDPSDHLAKWAESDIDLIIGLGFLNAMPINELSAQYPEQKFALIDVAGTGPNIWSATFREYEGDFVVGVLAALVTETKTVGFMGGGVTPIVRRIEMGFAKGVQNVDSSISIISDYVGEFDDENKGRILAETQYSMGSDVIYQVAGRCGLGAIKAAQEFRKWIISTGGDHSDLAPNSVLTSRIKNVGRPVRDVIKLVLDDDFEGGINKQYGFAEGGLMMAPIRPSVSKTVTPSIQALLQEVQAQVISGGITVNLDD